MAAVRRLHVVEGDPPDSLSPPASGVARVAFATHDMKNLDAHFGSAPKFALYDVTPRGWSFVEALGFDHGSDESGAHRADGDDRIAAKIAALRGCHLLYCLAIGGPAAARAVKARIHPVKTQGPAPIGEILEDMRAMLAAGPPLWLRKALSGAQAADEG